MVLLSVLYAFVRMLKDNIGEVGPVAVMLSLIGVHGWQLLAAEHRRGRPIDRDILHFPEVVITDLEQWDASATVRPMFYAIWQACGFDGSPSFRAGDWKRS